jgi:hypothetical protein
MYFQQFEAVDPMLQQGRGQPTSKACNSFDADKVAGRTSDVYDINGLVAMVCRWALVATRLHVWLVVNTTPKKYMHGYKKKVECEHSV